MIKMETNEAYQAAWAMRTHGGTFIRALGIAIALADTNNQEKIKAAFPVEWTKYHAQGKEKHDLLMANKDKFRCLSCGSFFTQTTDMNACPDCGDMDIEFNDGSLPE